MERIVFLGLEAGDSTYFRGEAVRVRVAFTRHVAVSTTNGKPYVDLMVGAKVRRALFVASKLNRLDFSYTVQPADRDADGVSVAANALKLNGAEIKAKDNAALDANAAHGAVAGGAARKVDGSKARAPRIRNVAFNSAPASGDTYGYGEEVVARVAFDRPVVVSTTGGKPRLALTVGTQVRHAALSNAAGTHRRLDFSYAVQGDDRAPGGVSIAADALSLNGGTIKAAADSTTAAALAHGAVAADATRKIDGRRGRPPRIDRIAFGGPEPYDSTYWRGDTIVVEAGFDAKVAVDTTNGKPQVALTIGSSVRQAVYSAHGEETLRFSYVVQQADADPDGIGIAANALALNGGRIMGTDAASRAADLAHSSVDAGGARKVDGSKIRTPKVKSVAFAGPAPEGGAYRYGRDILVQVAFDRSVVVDTTGGKPQLELTIGTRRRQAVVAAPAGAAAVLDFTYKVQSADLDADGASVAANALALNGGTIKASADGTTAVGLAHGALAATSARKVDGRPRIMAMELVHPPGRPLPPRGIYKFEEIMWIRARFDQQLAMTGRPRVSLVVGTDTVQVVARRDLRQQNRAVEFPYRVPRGVKDANGVSVPKGSLDLNGGTLKAASDNVTNASLDHGGIAPDDDYKVDGNVTPVPRARISWRNRPASGDTYTRGERIRIRATFHTRVAVAGNPQMTLQVGTRTRQLTAVGATAWGPMFDYVVQAEDQDADGVSVPANALSLPAGATIQAVADANVAASLVHDSLPADASRKVDGSAAGTPKVRTITVSPLPSSDSTYTRGENFYVNVHFDRDVAVDTTDGKPRVALDVGGTTRYATYSHAHNLGPTLQLFMYTVQASDVDTDGVSISANALSANGGSITALGGTAAADLSHSAVAADSARKVNGGRTGSPRPRWLWLASSPASGDTYRQGESIKVDFTFDRKAVVDTAAGVPYVEIDIGGTKRRASWRGPPGPSVHFRFAYVVQASDVDPDGVSVPASTLSANGGSIRGVPGAANAAVLAHDSLPANAAHKVTGASPPRALRVSIGPNPSSDSTYTLHEQFAVDVSFDRAVAVDTTGGKPRIALDVGGTTRYATYSHAHNVGPTLHVFTYTVQASDMDADGVSISANALSANGGSITALGGTAAADLSHSAVAADSARKVNGGRTGSPRPRWLWLASSPASGDTYRQGESIKVDFNFDRKAVVDTAAGVPYVEIDVGGAKRRASWAGPSSPSAYFRFAYVVQTSDMDADGVSVPASTLSANGGSIRGVPGAANAAVLAHDSLPTNAAHKVNGASASASANRRPEIAAAMAPKTVELASGPVSEDLSAYFRDPDGDELAYSAVSAAQPVAVAVAGDALTVQPQAVGQSLVTVRAVDPAGAEAEQSFLVTVEASRSDRTRILERSLAAFGRTVAAEAVEAIGGRLGAGEDAGSLGRSHFQLGGRTLSCDAASGRHGCGLQGLARQAAELLGVRVSPGAGALASALRGAANGGLDAGAARALADAFGRPGLGAGGTVDAVRRDGAVRWGRLLGMSPMSRRELLSRASFRLSPGGGEQATAGGWTFWAQANAGGFKERSEDGLALDATVRSAYLGTDYRFGQGPLAGLALSRTTSAIAFESRINDGGTVDAKLTSVHPYVQWSPRNGLSVWGLLGAGWGDADMSEAATGRRFETSIATFMTAAGARQEIAGPLAFKADAFAVRTDAEGAEDLPGVAARAYRLRLAPEVGRRWAASKQASVRSRAELGLRIDGGDAETGVGAEAGAELAYAHEGMGLHVGVRGRTLVAHQAEAFRDWGASLSVRLEPGREAGGLSLRLEPTWGNVASGAASLWRDGTVGRAFGGSFERSPARQAAPSPAAVRLDVETGYAFVVPDFGRIAPFGRWAVEGESDYRVNAGIRLSALDATDGSEGSFRATIDLFGEHATRGVEPADRRLGLRGAIRFK